MSIFIKKDKKRAALEKEYASVLKKETQLKQSAMKTTAPRWKTDAREGLPQFRDSFQQGVFRGIYSRRRGH